jgi:hypothetical protein
MSDQTYIQQLADEIRHSTPENLVPDGDTDSLFLIYAVLALAKGTKLSAADVHNAWAAWMSQKDPNHEAIRPYEELSEEAKSEDSPFAQAIRSVARRRGLGRGGETPLV